MDRSVVQSLCSLHVRLFDGTSLDVQEETRVFDQPQQVARFLVENFIPHTAVPFLFPVERRVPITAATLNQALSSAVYTAPQRTLQARMVIRACGELSEAASLGEDERCREKLTEIARVWNSLLGSGPMGVRMEFQG